MDQDRKSRILDAAEERFAKYGFKKTSIDEIAAAAAVGKGSVYLICESKEDLFYQVVHRDVRDWCSSIARLIDPRQPAPDLLAACSMAAYAYLDDHPLVRDLLLGNYTETLPLWIERLEDLRAIGRANTVEILRIGMRQGLFRDDLDVERIALIIQDLLAASLLVAHRSRMAPMDQAANAATGLDLLLRGLLLR